MWPVSHANQPVLEGTVDVCACMFMCICGRLSCLHVRLHLYVAGHVCTCVFVRVAVPCVFVGGSTGQLRAHSCCRSAAKQYQLAGLLTSPLRVET